MTHTEARLDAAEILELARAHAGPDGRLPAPDLAANEIFPFEGQMRVRPLEQPVLPEPARMGEGGKDCRVCDAPDEAYLWARGGWRLRTAEPQPLPSFLLEPREHVDLGDLDERQAAELGALIVRVERAIAALPGVGRVHVNRWGDGAEHLHIWFFARPAGVLQLRGSSLPDWLDVLPPLPPDRTQAIAHAVADALQAG